LARIVSFGSERLIAQSARVFLFRTSLKTDMNPRRRPTRCRACSWFSVTEEYDHA